MKQRTRRTLHNTACPPGRRDLHTVLCQGAGQQRGTTCRAGKRKWSAGKRTRPRRPEEYSCRNHSCSTPGAQGRSPCGSGAVQAALSRPYLVSGVNGTLRVLRFGQRVDFGKGAGGKFPQIRLHERQRGVDVADKLLLAAIKAPPFGYKKTRHIGRAK